MTAPPTLGLDFGTTNTVATLPDPVEGGRAIMFRHQGLSVEACRSVLTFWHDEETRPPRRMLEAGPWAIDRFIELDGDCRFIQSFKTFAASPLFTSTLIAGRAWTFEDLLAAYLRRLGERAGEAFPRAVLVGRPVGFAGAMPDEALARARYEAALTKAGFDRIGHVYEPVAAAFFFARRLTRDATILVADFGGGTSDFSILRFTAGAQGRTAEALAHRGLGVAGDTFDRRVIDHVVAPLFGKGGEYLSDGKILPMPHGLYARLGEWNHLSIMRHTRDHAELVKLARLALDPGRVEAFLAFLDAEAGLWLHQAVSRAKNALSTAPAVDFHLAFDGGRIERTITRADFDGWIAADLDRLDAVVGETLAAAGLTESGVDKVFLTGGSSFVPALRARFDARFGPDRVETGDQFVSIAHGLALIAQLDDPGPWLA
jgi:hypothetical chaperone protein